MTYGEKMRKEGWTNVYDELPKEAGKYLVKDRAGHMYKAEYYNNGFGMVWKNSKGGYDLCWWRKEK